MGRIGINNTYWGTDFTASVDEYERRISRAAGLGFELVSFSQDVPLALSRSEQQRLLSRAEQENVKLNYLGGLGPDQDICSDSAEVRRNGVEHLRRLVRKLAEMQEGAELAGALTGVIRDSLRGREKQRCWEHCVRSMKEAIKEAEDCGVIVSVEVLNRFEHFLLNTCDEALRFVDEVGSPNLKILLDTYHMNIEEDSLGQAIIKAGDRLGLLHVAESNRRPPGNGHIPWDEVIGALKQIDYQGDTVLEPIIVPGGVIGNVFAVWRDLTGGLSLDEAARRGLEFYKARLGSA